MIFLSQRDSRWAANKLGASSLTIGRFGCTTTCLSMLSDYYKQFQLPSYIAGTIKFYTPDGLIIWQNLDFDKFQFVKRLKNFDPLEIDDSIKNPNKSVILNVWNGSHWVVAIRKNLFGAYVVADPWSGKAITIRRSDISGSAHFLTK